MSETYKQCPSCQGMRFVMGMGMMHKSECEKCEGLGIIDAEGDQVEVPTDVYPTSSTAPSLKKRGRPPKVRTLELRKIE